jgi:hypothetical protein
MSTAAPLVSFIPTEDDVKLAKNLYKNSRF